MKLFEMVNSICKAGFRSGTQSDAYKTVALKTAFSSTALLHKALKLQLPPIAG
jgi:hypothetical protein